MYKQLIICINLVLISITAFGQENYRAGTLTQLNLNFKPAKNLKLNTKIESRQLFSQKETGATAHHKFQYDRADLTFLLTTRWAVVIWSDWKMINIYTVWSSNSITSGILNV
jgi:hypothetical protein